MSNLRKFEYLIIISHVICISQVTEYILLYGKGVLLRQLKEDRTFPPKWPLRDKNSSSKGMKVIFKSLSDAVSDFTPAVSSFPLSWLKYFPIWPAWKLGTALKTGHTTFKNSKRVSNSYCPFQTHTQSNTHSLSPNSCPTLQWAAVWTDTHLAKVNMVFSSYTHTDTIMGNPMVGQTSLTLVKAKTHVRMSIDFLLFCSPVLLSLND